ncbi:MAG: hypothetical protein E7280_03965 [Lachnospiraceae bacterium]|nr:hypothetical protein [Lachnospiraceae bacterium]
MLKQKILVALGIVVIGISFFHQNKVDVSAAEGNEDISELVYEDDEMGKLLNSFEEAEVEYDEQQHIIHLHVENPFRNGVIGLFINDICGDAALGRLKLGKFLCDATFNMDDLTYFHRISLQNSAGKELTHIEKRVVATVNEYGGLQTIIDLGNGKKVDLGEKSALGLLSESSVLADYEKTYYILASKAVAINSQSNYEYNKRLEDEGNGVNKGNYIYNQTEARKAGYKSAEYKFGFGEAKFKNVGCEIAACYNVAIALGKPERLSTTIKYAEGHMKIHIAFGHWGCSPEEIKEYLEHKGFNYVQEKTMYGLKRAADGHRQCKIIMSRWNDPVTTGFHTFYVNKVGEQNFRGYNHEYLDGPGPRKTSLDSFDDGAGFMQGYVIWN